MSVNNGAPADETTFNNAYLSRLSDSDTIGKIDLANADSANITDVQSTINDQRTDIDQNRADIDTNDTELADHESRISINETDIAAIQGDYVDLDTNQTIAGEKTFSGTTTTIQGDLIVEGDTFAEATLDVTDKNITVNNGGSDATSEGAGLTVERVGTDGSLIYEDTLDNKFKLGSLGSEEEISAIVKDTLVNLQALVSPSSSNLYFATDTLEHFRSDGTSLQALGSGGGGGGLDTFHTESFETTVAADWSTGNSATFLTAGSGLVGALSDETTTPIAGDSSLKYVSAAVSINDWIASPTYDLDLKQRGNDIGLNFYFTLPTDATYEVVFWDVTNSAKLNSVLDTVIQSDGRIRYSSSVFIPDTCTQYKYGFHSIIENGAGHTLIVDDFEFSTNPFVYKNLSNDTDWISYTPTTQGLGTIAAVDLKYRRVGSDIEVRGRLDVGTPTAAEARIGLPLGVTSSSNINALGEFAGGTVTNGGAAAGRTAHAIVYASQTYINYSYGDNTRDFYTKDNGNAIWANSQSISVYFKVPIEGWSVSTEHVVTPAKSNITSVSLEGNDGRAITANTEDIHFTGSDTGWTSVGDTHYYTVQNRDSIINLAGSVQFTGAADRDLYLYKNGTYYRRLDDGYASTTSITVFSYSSGKGEFSLDDQISIRVSVTSTLSNSATGHYLNVTESGDATFLAAVPIQKVAYLKDVKAAGVQGGTFTSGAWRTRDLQTIEGDSSFASIITNQFTLSSGEYVLDWSAPANGVDRHQSRLRNITDSTSVIGSNESIAGNLSNSFGHAHITITDSKLFEIQHQCVSTGTTTGFGGEVNTGFSVDFEVYTQVKITKLR